MLVHDNAGLEMNLMRLQKVSDHILLITDYYFIQASKYFFYDKKKFPSKKLHLKIY